MCHLEGNTAESGKFLLSQDEAVFKALDCHVPQHIVIVLVSGGHQPHGMTGIFQKLFLKKGIAHILVEAELAVGDMDSVQVYGFRKVFEMPGSRK